MTIKLNNGVAMPTVGFGTADLVPDDVAADVVSRALGAGFRLLDTASRYENEAGVGRAVRQSTIPRRDTFVTTKLWTNEQGYESAHAAFDASLERLGLEYVDLYLIHWPGPFHGSSAAENAAHRKESWRALEEIYKSGRAKAIGVSNFTENHLAELARYATVQPAVNQIELHPFVYKEQKAILEYCQRQNIIVEGYSPLSRGGRINDAQIGKIAKQLGRTNAQVFIRWAIQHGTVPLPRSKDVSHIAQNYDVFGFELSEADMKKLDDLSDGTRFIESPYSIP